MCLRKCLSSFVYSSRPYLSLRDYANPAYFLLAMEHMLFTVSLHNPTSPVRLPGRHDPAIGELVADALHSARSRAPPGSALQQHYQEAESQVAAQTLRMTR